MRKFTIKITSVLLALSAALCLTSCGASDSEQIIIHCYEYSAAYDYAVDIGVEPFIIYGANKPDFDSNKDEFGYKENETGYEITSYSGSGKLVYIPEEHDGKPVNAIDEGTFDDVTVKEIYIPESVVSINCDFQID